MKARWLIACAWLAFTFPAAADLWTNQAGRILEAALEKFDGASVTFVRTNGARLVLPLRALSPADQRRVKQRTGHTVVPAFVQGAYLDARSILDRFEALPAEQRTDEARAGATRTACAVFDGRVEPRRRELKDPEVARETRRLRDALEGK